jgi:hypothetical protein
MVEVSSGNQDFDKCFHALGSPRGYVQGAVDLIVRRDPHLLPWILRNSTFIELKGERLVCDQHAELTNVDDQISLLDLLCDLAELAEEIRSSNVKHGEVEREQ